MTRSKKNYFSALIDFIYRHRLLAAWLFVLGIFSVFDIAWANQFRMPLGLKIAFTLTVAAFKTVIIMVLLQLLLRNRFLKALGYAGVIIYTLLAFTNLFSFLIYGFGISRKLVLIAGQTTPKELSGFLPQLLGNMGVLAGSAWFWIAAAGIILLLVMTRAAGRKIFLWTVSLLALAGFFTYTVFAATHSSGRTAVALTARLAKYSREVYRWEKDFEQAVKDMPPLPDAASVQSRHLARTVIVVIGESASRAHHSAYGYPLPTTPNLDARKQDIFRYTNAIGSSAATAGNMERILSLKPDDSTTGDGLEYPLLIDIFNAADYKTFWLSNQERTGIVSNTSGVMTFNASVIRYVGAENSEDALVMQYDEALLPELQEALKDTTENKLIFLHLLGSHTKYADRYPADFGRFTAEDELRASSRHYTPEQARTRAQYDNSILYTDHVLGRVMAALDREKTPALMIYFSDHGENVYDEGDYCRRGERFVEVPFLIYPNESYRALNPELIGRIGNSVASPISTANFAHPLMSLTGTTYKHYDPTLDPLSPAFIPRRRYVDEELWKYDSGVK